MAESICADCEHKRYCPSGLEQRHNSYITGCSRYEKKTPTTQTDRIRAMSDEELASLLVHSPWFREESALDWLKQEVDSGPT